jgi:predicted SAM-dependent methyltransferase
MKSAEAHASKTLQDIPQRTPIVLDLGCGSSKTAGSYGIDVRVQKGVDLVFDLEREFPLRSSCADVVRLSHVIEHMNNLIGLMEEVYRICRPGAVVQVIVPYYTSRGAFRDPTHVRYITEDTFQYFEPPTDYGIRTQFKIERITYDMCKPFRWFPAYFQRRCRRYLWNTVDNMEVTLRVIKEGDQRAHVRSSDPGC